MALPQVGLEAVIAGLSKFQAGGASVEKVYNKIDIAGLKVEKSSGLVNRTLSGVTGTMLTFGKFAAGAALTGATVLAGGIAGATYAGLNFNNSIEQATARINAFTKDGKVTAQIIDSIRIEAAKTPFTFQQMTDAVASLMPATKQSGESLESLISTAEILAASNPLQGLEGASFSLREAISGDFTSIIERFNLSRDAINKLKEEGVPSIEIVRRVMADMGLDASLVANMANTLQGRWSTFTDTLTTFAGTATQPLFDTLSAGLGQFNTILANNQPLLDGIAQRLAGVVAAGIQGVINLTTQIMAGWTSLTGFIQANFGPQLTTLGEILTKFWAEILPPLQMAWQILGEQFNSQIMPALIELGAALGIAAEEGNLWQIALGTLKLVLAGVVLGIKVLTPLIIAFVASIRTGISALTTVVGLVVSFKHGLDGIGQTIGGLSRKVEKFAEQLFGIQIPDWLLPGSPTPFEIGLAGIAKLLTSQMITALQLFGNQGTLTANSVKAAFDSLAQRTVQNVAQMNAAFNSFIQTLGSARTSAISLTSSLNQVAAAMSSIASNSNSASSNLHNLNSISLNSIVSAIKRLGDETDETRGEVNSLRSAMQNTAGVSFSAMVSWLNQVILNTQKATAEFLKMAEAAKKAASASSGTAKPASLSGLMATSFINPPVTAPVLAGAGGQTVYMENNFGGNTISGGMDQAQFDAMVLRSLQRLMG